MCPDYGLEHQLPGVHVPWCCIAVDGWEGRTSVLWLSEISFTGQGKGWKNCRIHWVLRSAPQLHFGRNFGRLLHLSNIPVAGRRPLCIGLILQKDGKQTREAGMYRNIPSGLCLLLFFLSNPSKSPHLFLGNWVKEMKLWRDQSYGSSSYSARIAVSIGWARPTAHHCCFPFAVWAELSQEDVVWLLHRRQFTSSSQEAQICQLGKYNYVLACRKE